MKYIKSLLIILFLLPVSAFADAPGHNNATSKHNKENERAEWFRKLKETKHGYIVKELNLTEAQRSEFFRLYDAKENERHEAERKVRALEKNIKDKGAAVSDDDYDRAIKAQYQLNKELANIECKYESEFRKVLTKQQLYKLRYAEFGFQRKLMKQEHKPEKR